MLRAKIRLFRAPDDPSACRRYSQGHREVLEYFDITQVTSAGIEWFSDPTVLVVMVEDEADDVALGGVRLVRPQGAEPLPIEHALTSVDPEVHRLVRSEFPGGTAELCGLWSSRRLRGAGMGELITRMGLYLAAAQGLGAVYGVCDRRSLERNRALGFQVESRLADCGTFRYPRPDLTAYVLRCELDPLREPGRPGHETIREFVEAPFGATERLGREGMLQITWDLRSGAAQSQRRFAEIETSRTTTSSTQN